MTQAPDLEAFLATVEKLPTHLGLVFRGCGARSHERWPGRALVTEGLVSTSRDPRVATENFTTEAVYAILSRNGRQIEHFSAARHEQEVLLLPGTVLTLVTRVRVGDLGVTVVEEFDPHHGDEGTQVDAHELQVEIGRAILEAQARPVVEPIRSGRLAGDIV